MPKLQRNPATHKVMRSAITHKVIRGNICCCGRACCNANCIKLTFTNWPAYTSPPGTVYEPFSFIEGEWLLKRRGGCVFDLVCTINETIDSIHYILLRMTLYLGVNLDGKLYVQSFDGGLVSEIGTDPAIILHSIDGVFTDGATAVLPGCDQVVHCTIGDGTPFPTSELTVEKVIDADCVEPDCTSNGCNDCCVGATCANLVIQATYDNGVDDPVSYDYSFPLVREGLEGCFYYGECLYPSGNKEKEALAHVVCNGEGDPYLVDFYFAAYFDGLLFFIAAITEPMAISCSGDNTLDLTLFADPPTDTNLTIDTAKLTIATVCEPVENCITPPLPHECPDDCITCTVECGPRCWTGSTLTFDYNIGTGECGNCTGGVTGCGLCCDCPFPVDPGDCEAHAVANAAACAAGGWCWQCPNGCIEDGGGGPSTCSRIDFSGTGLELAFTAIITGNPHFGTTLTLGADTVVFDVWFDCVAERWYARIIWNGHCIFEGDINGGCESFSTIELTGRDGDLTGSNCVMLSGTLTSGTVTFADYVCPP